MEYLQYRYNNHDNSCYSNIHLYVLIQEDSDRLQRQQKILVQSLVIIHVYNS